MAEKVKDQKEFEEMLAQAIKLFDEGSLQCVEPTPQQQRLTDARNAQLALNNILDYWQKTGEERTNIRFHLRRELNFHMNAMRTADLAEIIQEKRKAEKERQGTFSFMSPPSKR